MAGAVTARRWSGPYERELLEFWSFCDAADVEIHRARRACNEASSCRIWW